MELTSFILFLFCLLPAACSGDVDQLEVMKNSKDSSVVEAGVLRLASNSVRIAHSYSPSVSSPRRALKSRRRRRNKRVVLGVVPSVVAIAIIVAVLFAVFWYALKMEEKKTVSRGQETNGEGRELGEATTDVEKAASYYEDKPAGGIGAGEGDNSAGKAPPTEQPPPPKHV